LDSDVRQVEEILEEWRPDVVVTNAFAVAPRIGALRSGVPLVTFSMYPQHSLLGKARGRRRFGKAFLDRVASVAGSKMLKQTELEAIAWGLDSEVPLMHDSYLLGNCYGGEAAAAGFPYWDKMPAPQDTSEQIDLWLKASTGPRVLITLGSFIGLAASGTLALLVDGLRRIGVSVLVAGAPNQLRTNEEDLCITGFVPLSQITDAMDLVVHHGGLGTAFATLGSGLPAVIIPQAFDQPFNAALLERAGLAQRATVASLQNTVAKTLLDPQLRSNAQVARSALVPPAKAASTFTDLLESRASKLG
jgi:UDP:flavonoid glycosyltransferase YjiC (YdhE family)